MAAPLQESDTEPSYMAEPSEETMAAIRREVASAYDTVESRVIGVLTHNATTTLLSYIHGVPTTSQQLFECLFCSLAIPPFDTLCFCDEGWEDEDLIQDYGTFIRRNDIHLNIYAYVVKRATAISLLEAEGTRFAEERGMSATDPAFLQFVNAYTTPWWIDGDLVCSMTLEDGDRLRTLDSYGRTLMLAPSPERDALRMAYEIFTQRSMKFVTKWCPYHWPMPHGELKPLEVVMIHVKDVPPRGNFEIEWEHMPAHRSRVLYPYTDYDANEHL